jgi:Ca-activated chloride channel homolog
VVSLAAPARLWLLAVPVAATLAVVVRHRWRLAAQRRLASPSVWRRLMGAAPSTGIARLLTWCAAAVFLVLALARPQWGQTPREVSVQTRDVVLAIDVSDSMRCEDVKPSRLRLGLEVLRRALPTLAGNRVAAVVFAGDAYPLVPLTTDVEAVATFLDSVEPGSIALPGSNLERAVATSLELLPDAGKGRVIVLVTDGENLQGDLDHAVSSLKAAGVHLLGLLVGTADGGPIPLAGRDGSLHYKHDRSGGVVVTHARRATLERLAKATGGTVVDASQLESPADLARRVAALQSRKVGSRRRVARVERFQLFLAVAAGLLLAGFALSPWRRLTAVLAIVLALGAPGASAQAPTPAATGVAGPRDGRVEVPWYQRWVPGGSRRLARSGARCYKKGDLPKATKAFAGAASLDPQDPERQFDLGTTLAAQGKVKDATPFLDRARKGGVPDAAYNLGTAALQAEQAEPAVRWLRDALLENPKDPRAKRNYELALRLLKQQEKHDKNQPDKKGRKQQQPQSRQQKPGATPTPTPASGARRRPAPAAANPLYGALERAEAKARKAMQRPTPKAAKVEEDW